MPGQESGHIGAGGMGASGCPGSSEVDEEAVSSDEDDHSDVGLSDSDHDESLKGRPTICLLLVTCLSCIGYLWAGDGLLLRSSPVLK